MRLPELEAESRRESLELGPASPRRESFEEAADEVPLREPFDQAHLANAYSDLAGDRPRKLDPARGVGDDEADELVVGDERHGDPASTGAGRDLRPELRQRDRRPRRGAFGARDAQPQLVGSRLDQVDVARLGMQQAARAVGHRREQLLERLRASDRLGELGQRLELAHPTAELAVQPGILDRPGDEGRSGHEELDLVGRELARRLRVCGDDADHIAVLRCDRHAEQ